MSDYITDTCDPINTTGMSHLKVIIRLCYMQLLYICDNYDNHDRGHDSDEKYNNPAHRTVSPNIHIVKCTNHIPCHTIERNTSHIYLPCMLLNQ